MIGKLLIKLLVLYLLNGNGVHHRLYVSGTRLGRVDNCQAETVTVTLSPSITTSVSSLVLTRTVPSCVTGNRDNPGTTVRTLTTTVTSTVVLTTVAERQRESASSKAHSDLVISPQSQLSSCPSTTVTKTSCINNNNNTTTVDCVAKITGENIVEVALPWHAARQECRRRGGDLATPCYPADFINHIRDNYHKNALFWLGASDTESPNTFKWTTGAAVAGPWYPGHPQEGRSGFHCLGIQYTDERQSGIISGYDCTSSRWYICSR